MTARSARTRMPATVALLLWAVGCGTNDGPSGAGAPPSTRAVREMAGDASTGWDFDFDQTDIPPAPDPAAGNPDRLLPTPVPEGVLELVDIPVFEPTALDPGARMNEQGSSDLDALCDEAARFVDRVADDRDVGYALCTYALATTVGFTDRDQCAETVETAGGCALSLPLECNKLPTCSATVGALAECVREQAARRQAWVAGFGSCDAFDPTASAPDLPGLAGQQPACDTLLATCPGSLTTL